MGNERINVRALQPVAFEQLLAQLDRVTAVEPVDLGTGGEGPSAAFRDVTGIGASIDVLEYRKGPARAFSRHYRATYPMVFDPTGSTVGPWGGAATPQTFFVDRRGRIVDHVLGPVTDKTLRTGVQRALQA